MSDMSWNHKTFMHQRKKRYFSSRKSEKLRKLREGGGAGRGGVNFLFDTFIKILTLDVYIITK